MTHPQKIIKPRLLTADPGTTKYIVGALVGSRQHSSRGSGHLFLILAGVCLGVSPFIPAFAVVGFGALICGAMVMLALRESIPESPREMLHRLGLEQYVQIFDSNNIDRNNLSSIADPDLEKMGIGSLGHRRLICGAIGESSRSGGGLFRTTLPAHLFFICVCISVGIYNRNELEIWINRTVSGDGTGIPTCDSTEARKYLEDVVENGGVLPLLKFRLLDLQKIEEVGYNPSRSMRVCSGLATLNTGEETIYYRFFPSSDKARLLIEFQLLPFNPWVDETATDREFQKPASKPVIGDSVRALRSDMRDIATAEESHFVDHEQYVDCDQSTCDQLLPDLTSLHPETMVKVRTIGDRFVAKGWLKNDSSRVIYWDSEGGGFQENGTALLESVFAKQSPFSLIEQKDAKPTPNKADLSPFAVKLTDDSIALTCGANVHKVFSAEPESTMAGVFAIVDPFREIPFEDGMPTSDDDGPVLSFETLQQRVKSGPFSFPTFSYFSSADSTIGVLETSAGATGIGTLRYYFIDTVTCRQEEFEIGAGTLQWVDKNARPPSYLKKGNLYLGPRAFGYHLTPILGVMKFEGTLAENRSFSSTIREELAKISLLGSDIRRVSSLASFESASPTQKKTVEKILLWSFYVACIKDELRLENVLADLPESLRSEIREFVADYKDQCE